MWRCWTEELAQLTEQISNEAGSAGAAPQSGDTDRRHRHRRLQMLVSCALIVLRTQLSAA